MALDSIDTIAQLLHKADNASTEAERETFMEAAQRKAARASLTLADLRAHTKEKHDKQGKPIVKKIETGEKGQTSRTRIAELLWRTANIYGIKEVVANNGHYVKLIGLKEDIELVEVLYGSLVYQMVSDGQEYLKSDEHRSSGATRKEGLSNFYQAFISSVTERIRHDYQQSLSEYEKERDNSNDSMALVLQDKRKEVNAVYNENFKGLGKIKQDSVRYVRSAYSRGHASGKEANIKGRRQVDTGKAKIGG